MRLSLIWRFRLRYFLLSFFFFFPCCGVPGLRSLAYLSGFKFLTRTEDLAPDLPRHKYKVLGQGKALVPSEKPYF